MKIGIAGAGIGGLAAAALARGQGHDVVIYDQFDAPQPVGSGLVIQPVGQHVLDVAGAGDATRAMGQPVGQMIGHEARTGARVLDVTYDLARDGRHGLAIHRASLFDALYRAALAVGAEMVASSPVAGRDGARFVMADEAVSPDFDLLIDASGATSPLSPLQGRPLPYGAIWGTVPWPDDTVLPRELLSQKYLRAEHMLGVLPLGTMPDETTPLAAVFWSMRAGAYDAWRAAPLADWKAEATGLWPEFAPFLQTITDHDQMTMARYTHGTLARPWAEGMAFIGDAAHRASPQLGQGANMALLDAYALIWAMGQTADVAEALTLYARARRWHVWIYQSFSWMFTPQYQSDSRILPMIRDRVLMPMSRVPPAPRILSALVCGTMAVPVNGEPYRDGKPAGFQRVS